MAELVRCRVGEKIKTRFGVAVVLETQSWSQVVGAMSDAEAEEFTHRLRSRIGPDYRKQWQKLFIGAGNRTTWIENTEKIELLESRDV